MNLNKNIKAADKSVNRTKTNFIKDIETELSSDLMTLMCSIIKLPQDDAELDITFGEYGFDSLSLKEFAKLLNDKYNIGLTPAIFFVNDCISELTGYMLESHLDKISDFYQGNTKFDIHKTFKSHTETENNHSTVFDKYLNNFIAVIGMSGEFSGAKDLEDFWILLEKNGSAITEVPINRWDWRQFSKKNINSCAEKWGGFIADVSNFDAEFFNISPKEAKFMDPQHRRFLQVAYHAIENSAMAPSSLSSSQVGVFVGLQFNEYQGMLANASELHAYAATGTSHAMLANRLSYFLNLRGPSETIDTACSSSLVAVHHAVNALRLNECKMAIVGGVSLTLTPQTFIATEQMKVLSVDGLCKTFDAAANGYVKGEGICSIILKPLSEAIADNNIIHAVIRDTGVNHGGKSNALTAPNAKAQAELLINLYKKADVDINTVSYIEAHGTGTELGDPIEIEGLKKAFKDLNNKSMDNIARCGIGSVKANIGHLEPAAGLAGLIKVVLAMQHGTLPGNPHLKIVNPHIQLEDTPFYLLQNTQTWKRVKLPSGDECPYRAGVSSFGFGGTNAHVILEEYQVEKKDVNKEQPIYIIPISAINKKSLKNRARDLLNYLENATTSLLDISYTLCCARDHFPNRILFISKNITHLKSQLIQTNIDNEFPEDVFARFDSGDNKKAVNTLLQLKMSNSDHDNVYDLAISYIKGNSVNWNSLFSSGNARYVILPGYSFSEESYWIDSSYSSNNEEQVLEKTLHCYAEKWKCRDLSTDLNSPPNKVLIFCNDSNWINKCRRLFPETLWCGIYTGDKYHCSGQDYWLRLNNTRDIDKFLQNLQQQGILIDAVIHAYSNLSFDYSNMETQLEHSLYHSVTILQKLVKNEHYKQLRIIYAYRHNQDAQPVYAAMSAFFKSMMNEYPKWRCQIISLDNNLNYDCLINEIRQVSDSDLDFLVRYQNNKRWVPIWNEEIESTDSYENYLIPGGVYIITGGLGGIGEYFCNYLSNYYQAKLIIIGRRSLNDNLVKKIISIESKGAQITYLRGDISKVDTVTRLQQLIENSYQTVDGVIHAAGVYQEITLESLTLTSINETFDPKILGTLNVIKLAELHHPKLLICFSSLSSVLGMPKSSTYAYANEFINQLLSLNLKEDNTKMLSVIWPHWDAIGMSALTDFEQHKDFLSWMKNSQGLLPITSDVGFELFKKLLSYKQGKYIVTCEFGNKFELFLNKNYFISGSSQQKNIDDLKPLSVMEEKHFSTESLLNIILSELKSGLHKIIEIPIKKMSNDKLLGSYGLDSISLKEYVTWISNKFDIEIVASDLFISDTLIKLAEFILEKPNIIKLVKSNFDKKENIDDVGNNYIVSAIDKDIAVIGMAGLFPGSNSIEEFWDNLIDEKVSISETPSWRWNWKLFGECTRHAGFIDGVEQFDADFFDITESEAELMDPQQRLLMQVVYHALEHAAYPSKELQGEKVGVFIGAQFHDYQKVIEKSGVMNAFAATGNSNSMLANRISYFLDVHGPSEVIDTACSSSLVALHRARKSLLDDECTLAIVGGVSLLLDPGSFLAIDRIGVLSQSSRCYSFDERANGYVKGEGVGVVILKRLQNAFSDNDYIHAVIKNTVVNHGGKAHSLTAPNANAQIDLIDTAYRDIGIDLNDVSYLETHGTATQLGDAVEVKVLQDVWSNFVESNQSNKCFLGAVKANIGHLEPASGIAGLIKTILCICKRKIPPHPLFEKINNEINFKNSYFQINSTVQDLEFDEKNSKKVVGISSFGFGGVNAHAVIGAITKNNEFVSDDASKYHIVTLSGKNLIALQMRIDQLQFWLEDCADRYSLDDISYTLNAGRDHFSYRIATVVKDIKSLRYYLKNITINDVVPCSEKDKLIEKTDIDIVDSLTLEQSNEIVKSYCNGCKISWKRIYQNRKYRRIPMPQYPFQKKMHWVSIQDGFEKSMKVDDHEMRDFSNYNNIEVSKILSFLHHTMKKLFKKSDDQLNSEMTLDEMGINSINAANLIYIINEHYKVNIHLNNILKGISFLELSDMIRDEWIKNSIVNYTNKDFQKSLVFNQRILILNEQSTGIPIVMLHGGMGLTQGLISLSKLLPNHKLIGVHAKGIDGISMPHSSINEMTAEYAELIQAKLNYSPCILLGYCFGGYVAIELSSQFLPNVLEVVMIDTIPLTKRNIERMLLDVEHAYDNLCCVATNLLLNWQSECMVDKSVLDKIPRSQYLIYLTKYIISHAENIYSDHDSVYNQLVGIVNIMLNSAELLRDHQIYNNLEVPVTYIKAIEGFSNGSMLPKQTPFGDNYEFWWEKNLTKNINIVGCPGDHLTIFDMEGVEVIAKTLKDIIAKHDVIKVKQTKHEIDNAVQ